MRRLILACGAAAAALGAAGQPLLADAHALLQTSDPADGATLQQSPSAVTITFGEEPDARLSTISVVGSNGHVYAPGPAQPLPTDALSLRTPVPRLPRGSYTVTWRTVSTVDGHFATGAYTFGVGVAPGEAPQGAAVSSPRPSALAIAGRWMLYAGLVLLIGAALVIAVLVADARTAVLAMLGGAWLLAATGTAMVAESLRTAAGASWSDVFSTSLGHSLVWRIVTIALSGLLVAATVLLHGDRRRLAAGLAGAGAAAAMLVDVTNSHAAAESPVLLNDVMQWLHIAAVGVWIGGLAVLLLAIHGSARDVATPAIRRFSTAAGICLVVVAATGVGRAIIAIGAWDRITSTAFGQLVIIKSALIVVLAGLGAVNRYRHLPSTSRLVRGVRRVGTTEVVVGAAALLVAAALVNVAPPVSGSAAGPSQPQLVVSGSDYGTSVRVRLAISPGTAGRNTFVATMTDYDTGQPLAADHVTLTFAMTSRPDVGGSTLTLTRTGDGQYAASGSNLALDGTWRVTVLVQRTTTAVDVEMQVTPRTVPPTITRQPVPGQPTIYTIHLSGGDQIQVYLDPDKPGADKFHATFFDSAGNELPISSATITAGAGNAPQTTLTLQRLTAGHFAGDLTVGRGSTRFTISATSTKGDQLEAPIDITPSG